MKGSLHFGGDISTKGDTLNTNSQIANQKSKITCLAVASARRRENAFTLIELLVVIAVIGILAASLLSSFAAAKERAIRAKCLSNVRQITVASLSYAGDSRERFPVLLGSPGPIF